jgi:curved DNA-binding protein CbpA
MNYYEALGIDRDADKAAIKRAYFTMVKRHSPDRDPEGFKEIRISYETLIDDKKREEYDSYFKVESGIQNEILYTRELMRDNNYKKAIDYLMEQLTVHPGSVDLQHLLAEVYLRTGKTGKAESVCKELLASGEENAESWLLRGRIAEARGHMNKAAEHYSMATRKDPTNGKAWMAYIDYLEYEQPEYFFHCY